MRIASPNGQATSTSRPTRKGRCVVAPTRVLVVDFLLCCCVSLDVGLKLFEELDLETIDCCHSNREHSPLTFSSSTKNYPALRIYESTNLELYEFIEINLAEGKEEKHLGDL